MVVLFFILAITTSVLSAFAYKLGSTRMGKNWAAPAALCMFYMGLSTLISLALCAFDGGLSFSKETLLCAILSGVSFALAAYLYLTSMRIGPFTLSAAFINLSTFMPIIYSAVFLNEKLTLLQMIGFILMVGIVIVFTTSKEEKSGNKVNKRWIVFIISTFFVNSLIAFGLRIQSKLLIGTEKSQMLFLYFLIATITSAIIFLITKGCKALKWQEGAGDAAIKDPIYLKNLLLPCSMLAVILFLNIYANSTLPDYVTSVVHYPILSGSSLIISTLIGKVLFKEKFPKRVYFAILSGIAVIIMLSI